MPALRRGRSAARDAADAENLECPLCMELPEANVHQCSNGHLFCADCLDKHRDCGSAASSKCPTCRVALGDERVRNRNAEDRIGRMPGACDGCGAGMLRKDLPAHMAVCGDVVVDCPFPGCGCRVKRSELAAHMAAASEIHVKLAQLAHLKLEKAESTLASLSVGVEIGLAAMSDPANPLLERTVNLRLMQPIIEAPEFLNLLLMHDLHDLSDDCTTSVDISKSPYQLGIQGMSRITVRVPDRLIPPALLASRIFSRVFYEADTINLKVVSESGEELFFKCKPDTKLDKLMTAWCNRNGVPRSSVRFLFDGEQIDPNDTPTSLEMEDGDVIDVAVIV